MFNVIMTLVSGSAAATFAVMGLAAHSLPLALVGLTWAVSAWIWSANVGQG